MAVAVWIHVVREDDRLSESDPKLRTFEAMYRRWHPDVVEQCRRLLGRSGDAEAAAQEAFVRAWVAFDRYSPARPFGPWIAAIARRLCLDQRRHASRRDDATVLGERDEQPSPDVVIEAAEDLHLVFRAIANLRPHERRALLLREIDGWSYRQIAMLEGVTIESVRGSLKRARATVRRAVSA